MNTLLFIGSSEIILILLVIFLLFGGKKVSAIAKALGKTIKEFKNAVNDIKKDVEPYDEKDNHEQKG